MPETPVRPGAGFSIRARRRTPIPTLAPSSGPGKDPAVARERPPPSLAPTARWRASTACGGSRADREAPQHLARVDQPGHGGHPAGGAVRPDHEVAADLPSGRWPESPPADRPTRAACPPARASGTAPASTAACAQGGVEARPAWPPPRSRDRSARPDAREADPPSCRAHHEPWGRVSDRPAGGARGHVSSCTPRGPMRSPQALSRGKAALSRSATRAPPRASTMAATLPPGPAPTTSTSNRRRHPCFFLAHWVLGASEIGDSDWPKRPEAGPVLRCSVIEMPITGDRNRFAQQLFTPLPERYDLLAEVLSFGQNGRWRAGHGRPDRAGRPGSHPRRGDRHRRRGHAAGGETDGLGRGRRPHPRDAAAGPATTGRLGPGRANPPGRRPGRAAAVRRRQLRRPDLHLPVALRRRPGRHPAGAGPGGQAGRHDGQPGLPRPHPGASGGPGGGSTPAACSRWPA